MEHNLACALLLVTAACQSPPALQLVAIEIEAVTPQAGPPGAPAAPIQAWVLGAADWQELTSEIAFTQLATRLESAPDSSVLGARLNTLFSQLEAHNLGSFDSQASTMQLPKEPLVLVMLRGTQLKRVHLDAANSPLEVQF